MAEIADVLKIPGAIPEIIIGGLTDNVKTEADGTIVMSGAATTFGDSCVPVESMRQAVAPTWATISGSVGAYTFAVLDSVEGSVKVPTETKALSDATVLLTVLTNGLEATDAFMAWELEYSVIGSVPGATVTLATGDVAIAANTPDKTKVTITLGTITGVSMGDIISFQLRRVTAVGVAPVANPFTLDVNVRTESDTFGSRTVTTK